MGGMGNILFQKAYGEYLKREGHEVYYVTNLTEVNFITKILGWRIHDSQAHVLFKGEFLRRASSFELLITVLFAIIPFFNGYSQFVREGFSQAKNQFGYFQSKIVLKKTIPRFLKSNYCFTGLTLVDRKVVHLRAGDTAWAQNSDYEKLYLRGWSFVGNLADLKCLEEKIPLSSSNGANNVIEDFIYLCSSSHIILSNSTYAWWAAHLGPDKKQVYISQFLYDRLGCFVGHEVVSNNSDMIQ